MNEKLWRCSICVQTSKRLWNLQLHIQRKHKGLGQPIRQSESGGYRNSASAFTSTMGSQNKMINDGSQAECDRIQRITEELVELKNMLTNHYPKEDVTEVLDMCCTDSLSTGTDTLLKIYLKSARRLVRFHDKLALLEQGMPNQAFSKMLKLAFFKATNDTDQRYPSPPYFGDVSVISPEEAKLPQ
jgi:hypothetical protein